MIINYNFFEADNKIAPAKGRILISEPFLQDNYFKRSIVLLTEHSENGTIGFVLNKPLNIYINEVIQDFPECEIKISLGGPVSTNTLHYIHNLGDIIPNSINVIEDIYWGGDFDAIIKLIKSKKINNNNIRFFLGYSGWYPGQLENELAENAWVVAEINPREILKPMTQNKWKTTLRKLGDKYKMWAEFPENPEMN